jgi:hypothetical protein
MTSNSELGLDTDPLTRIVQKRRRDCETLDKSVVASLIEVTWTEYTADPSNHTSMSSIIDRRDRLQWILTVYLDQAGKVRESTSNRRKAWNVVQGLLRKIDELLKAQRQTAEPQPPSQTQASAVDLVPVKRAGGNSLPTIQEMACHAMQAIAIASSISHAATILEPTASSPAVEDKARADNFAGSSEVVPMPSATGGKNNQDRNVAATTEPATTLKSTALSAAGGAKAPAPNKALSAAGGAKAPAPDKMIVKKKGGRGGFRTSEKKFSDCFGPFPSPWSKEVHTAYKAWRYEQQPLYRFIPREEIPTYNKKTHNRLQVGHLIRYKDGLGKTRTDRIFDFARDEIFTGPLIVSTIKFSDVLQIGMFRVVEDIIQEIPVDPYVCWVKRNPEGTQVLHEDWLLTRGAKYAGMTVDKGSADSAYEHEMVAPTLRQIPGEGYHLDPHWRCIMNLPQSSEVSMVSGHTAVLHNGTTRPCFICNKGVEVHEEQPQWTAVDLYFYAYNKRKGHKYTEGITKSLVKHCLECHPEHMFYFLIKSPLDNIKGVEYSVKLHVQEALRSGSEVIPRVLGYDLLLTALRDNNAVPLLFAFSFIFGAVFYALGPATAVKKMYELPKGDERIPFLEPAADAFFELARMNIKDMQAALMNFDIRTLLPASKQWEENNDGNDTDVYKIWNGVNAFFRRGVFDEEAFPGIYYVAMSDKTLEELTLEKYTAGRNPEPIAPMYLHSSISLQHNEP